MKKMKHYVIIGVEVILFGIISASAATSVPSHGVSYNNANSKANVSTVEAALNELYSGYTYGTATASQILTGKTALIKGTKVTGTMVNKAGARQAGTGFSKTESGTIGGTDYKATGSIKIPAAGYYNTDSTLTFDLTDNNNSYYDLGQQYAPSNLPTSITFSSSAHANQANLGANGGLNVPISLVSMYNTITFSTSTSSSVSSTPPISYLSLSGVGTNIKGSYSIHDTTNAVGAYINAHPNGTLSYQATINATTGHNYVYLYITLSNPIS